jgi:4-amino-4-deoxy-L-arabinose transferase-like glycosyltransferase
MSKRWITAILIAYVILGTVYNVLVPPFEAPDEVWHYLYVKHFAEGGRLPIYEEGVSFPMRQEASQPPLFYLLNGWATAWIDTRDAEQVIQYNPHAAVGTAAPWGNRNMMAHTSQERFPYRGTILAVHLVRFLCTLMGAGTVLCTFALARRLFPSLPWLALIAAGVNAFNPQFLFIHASASNDVLVTLLSALTLWLLVSVAYSGASVRRHLALGFTLGLASLTKLSGLLLLPLTALVLLVLARRKRSWNAGVRWFLWTFVPAAAVGGWWYVRNWMLYGDPFGLKLMFAVMTPRIQRPSFAELMGQLEGVFKSFWGVFGWFNLPMDDEVYTALAIITLLGAVGVLKLLGPHLFRRGSPAASSTRGGVPVPSARDGVPVPSARDGVPVPSARDGVPVPSARDEVPVPSARDGVPVPSARDGVPAIGLLTLWIVAYILGSVGYIQVLSSQGRLLFPALPAVAILLPLGLAQWLPERRRRAAMILLVGLLVCLAVIAPFRYISPAYAGSANVTEEQGSAVTSDPNWSVDFGERVRLWGYDLSETAVVAGNRLWLTLYWEGLQTMDLNYSVFVHLVDDRGVIVAQRDSWPGAGNDPTSGWQAGEWKRDIYPLDIPVALLAQGPCRIQVGLYDHATGGRLSAYVLEGTVVDRVVLPVELAVDGDSRAPLQELHIEFGGQIALTGYAVQPLVVHPGDRLEITLRWQAIQAVQEEYKAFVQLVRGGDQIWGQYDHVPGDSQSPTSRWIASQVVTETFELQVGTEAPEDRYGLLVGLYQSATVTRLRLKDGSDFVELGRIDVRK